MYTVTAHNRYRTITEKYSNSAAAFAGYFWHQRDKAVTITTDDERTIADSTDYNHDDRTDNEQESAERQYFLYYCAQERRSPDSLLGFISRTESAE